MLDLSKTAEAKSDQLNAVDLAGGPLTILITDIKLTNSPDQPIAISYNGDGGKPYKPSKGMRRALMFCWGKDGEQWIGRSATLYCDSEVTWAGAPVGGIKVSHLSDIDEVKKVPLRIAKSKVVLHTIEPLKTYLPEAKAVAEKGTEQFKAWYAGLPSEAKAQLKPHMDTIKTICTDADKPPKEKDTK